jgi:hypothetical protein
VLVRLWLGSKILEPAIGRRGVIILKHTDGECIGVANVWQERSDICKEEIEPVNKTIAGHLGR